MKKNALKSAKNRASVHGFRKVVVLLRCSSFISEGGDTVHEHRLVGFFMPGNGSAIWRCANPVIRL